MDMETALEGFRIDRLACGYSRGTVVGYVHNVELMIEHLDNPKLHEVTGHDLKNFFYFLRHEYVPKRFGGDTSPLSPASIDNYWIAMRSFFGWCEDEFGIDRPDEDIPQPQYKPPEIIPFTKDEVEKLIKASLEVKVSATERKQAYNYRPPKTSRNKAIILLLLDTGIRLGELVRLKREDVNLETGDVTVKPYGRSTKSKPRSIPLGRVSKKALWKHVAGIDDFRPEDTLFELSHGGVQSMINRLQKRSGVDQVNAHKFRHTFAVEFLKNGGDIYTLKYFLGHSSLEMVQRYLHFTQADRRDAHNRAAPGDRWFKRKRF
ncbi:MAG: Tyrosine recombinase XerC [Chloroflexi bacterium]|nr:Tyrosine recombinase XerC [Chloroflexota bacterium]